MGLFNYTTPGSDYTPYGNKRLHGFGLNPNESYTNLFKSELDMLAKDYGMESLKPILGNTGGSSLSSSIYGPSGGVTPTLVGSDTGALNKMLSFNTKTSMINGEFQSSMFPHEIGHVMSTTLRDINPEGGMKIHDKEPNITSITGFTNSSEDFLKLKNKYIDANTGNLNRDSFKSHLYNRFMKDENNNQRPVLKHTIAEAVSQILTDPKIEITSKFLTEKGFEADYIYTPEEMWGRAWAAFSEIKRDTKGTNKRARGLISTETYDAIQKVLDTIKVRHGNTISKSDFISAIKQATT